jgi:hypothetical protein
MSGRWLEVADHAGKERRPRTGRTSGRGGTAWTRGEPGAAGAIIAAWEIDEVNYRARAVMSDGTDGGTLDLRTMFEQFHNEVR